MAITKQRFKQLAGLLKEAVLTEQVRYTIEEEADELYQSIEESQRMLRILKKTIGTRDFLDDVFDLRGVEGHLNDAERSVTQIMKKATSYWKSEMDAERREQDLTADDERREQYIPDGSEYLTDAREFVSVLQQYGREDEGFFSDPPQTLYDVLVEEGYVDEEDSNSVGAAEEAIEEYQMYGKWRKN